jgi:hypothetical protein
MQHKKIISRFKEETGGEMHCENICGKKFSSAGEHSEYVQNAGCENLISKLSEIAAH